MNDAPPRHPEYQYLDILQELLDHGDERRDRTGVGTLALFGRHMRFDVSDTFPVLTTWKTYWQTAIREMLRMLSGGRNIRELVTQGVHIWTDNRPPGASPPEPASARTGAAFSKRRSVSSGAHPCRRTCTQRQGP